MADDSSDLDPTVTRRAITTGVVFNVVAAVLIAGGFWYAYTNAYADTANCNGLITDRYGVPGQVCNGATAGDGVVGRAIDLVGGDSETQIVPGLSGVIDGPLESVRRLSVAAYLFGLMLVAFVGTFIYANAARLVRLATLDRDEWLRTLATTRVFFVIVAALMAVSVVALRPF